MTPVLGQTVTRGRGAQALVAAAALLVMVTSPVGRQAASEPRLSSIEQKIRDYVRAHESDQIAFLEKAVNIKQ